MGLVEVVTTLKDIILGIDRGSNVGSISMATLYRRIVVGY